MLDIHDWYLLINLTKRGYCNAGVCLSVCLCICVSAALYHTITLLNGG